MSYLSQHHQQIQIEQAFHKLKVYQIYPFKKEDLHIIANESNISISSGQNVLIVGQDHVTVKSNSITLHGTTTFGTDDAFLKIQMLTLCNSCSNDGSYGFSWPNPNDQSESPSHLELCMNCIYASALHYQAKQSWTNENGDPMTILQKEVQLLKEQVNELKNSPVTH